MSDPRKTPQPDPSGRATDRRAAQGGAAAHFDESSVPWTGLSILIVVAGLILFMAVPWRPPSARHLMELQTSLRADIALEQLSLAVQDYRHDHGEWPGARPAEAGTLAAPIHDVIWLERQLSMSTNNSGEVSPQSIPEFPHGPYLSDMVPVNPSTGFRTVRILHENESFERVRDGIYGWLYNPRTGEIRAHRLPFARKNATHQLH